MSERAAGATQQDAWVVVIGRWHFGPFANDEAVAFAQEHGGREWPLWGPSEHDALARQPAVALAAMEVQREN